MATDWAGQILAAEERLRQAQLHNDVAALDALLAPNLLFTGHLGQQASKADDLAAHRARLLHLTEATVLERHIQLHPGFAVVSTLLHLAGRYDGQPIDQQMRYTRVWTVTEAGALQVVAGHMSVVPPA
jgi:ketosteroid isomerase-like protein